MKEMLSLVCMKVAGKNFSNSVVPIVLVRMCGKMLIVEKEKLVLARMKIARKKFSNLTVPIVLVL
jgi:hypothetical protein